MKGHAFTPWDAGKFRALRCAKYLKNIEEGIAKDEESKLTHQISAEKEEQVLALKTMLETNHALVHKKLVLELGSLKSVLADMVEAAGSHPICFFDGVTIVPDGLQDFPNVARFEPSLLSVKIVDNELVVCLYIFTNTAVMRNRHGFSLTLSALVLEDLLRTDGVQDVANVRVCASVGMQRVSLNWEDCDQSTTDPASWDHVKKGMYEHHCRTFAKSIHERYPKEVASWTMDSKCDSCPFRSTCTKAAEGTLKLLPGVRDFVRLVPDIDPEDNEGLVKLQRQWARRGEGDQLNMQQIAAKLRTDRTDDNPAMLAAALQNEPVLRTPAVLHIQREQPDVELVVSFLYFEDRTATLFSGCCVVIDRNIPEPQAHDLGMTVHTVRETLEGILRQHVNKTMQIYTVTYQERLELESFISLVRKNDREDRYPALKSIGEGYPVDIFGGMDAFNEANLTLRAQDAASPKMELSRSPRVKEWLMLSKNVGVPFTGSVNDLGTAANAVKEIATFMGTQLGLEYVEPEDVIEYCAERSGKMARTTDTIIDLQSQLFYAYFLPQTAHIDRVSEFKQFGCEVEGREAYLLMKDHRPELHRRAALAGAELLSGKWFRGAVGDGSGAAGTIVALGKARSFPYAPLHHMEQVVCDMRFVSQKYLLQNLRKVKRSKVVTLVANQIQEDSDGFRIGTASVLEHENHLQENIADHTLVLEGQSGSNVGNFNDFQFLCVTPTNQCWRDLENTGIGSFGKPNVKDSIRLKIKGTEMTIRVDSRTSTRWLKEGTVFTMRRRLLDMSFYETAQLLLRDDFAAKIASLLNHPKKHNDMTKPVGEVRYQNVKDQSCQYLFHEQQQVVQYAIHKAVSIVCGPPGTGKTIALSTAVATIVSERAREGRETMKIFVTANGWKPIRLLLTEIAKRVYHPHVVVCAAQRREYILYNNVNMTEVPFVDRDMCPKFIVIGVNKEAFRKYNVAQDYNREWTTEIIGDSMSEEVHAANEATQIKLPTVFEMGVVDEGSQMWCRDLPSVLNRLHARGRFVVSGDPLQMQPINDDRVRLGENVTSHFTHPVHDSVLLCLLRKRGSQDGNGSLADKFECKEALNPTFITKLTHCLRSHGDIASLSRTVYETDLTAQQKPPCFDRWLKAATHVPSKDAPFTATYGRKEDSEDNGDDFFSTAEPFTVSSSDYEAVVAKEMTADKLGTNGKVGGLMSFEMKTPEEMNPDAYFVFSEAMCVALATNVQNNFVKTTTPGVLSILIIYPTGSPSQEMIEYCQNNPNLLAGTPERLQGQSADVVIVNAGMPHGDKRDRYYAPLPTMNVAFSRAECLQILLVPSEIPVSDTLAHLTDLREGLEHMQRYLTHARNTRVTMRVAEDRSLEFVSAAVPRRDPAEFHFHDGGVREWDRSVIEAQPCEPQQGKGKKGGKGKGKGKGDDGGREGGRGSKGGKHGGEKGGHDDGGKGHDSGSRGKGYDYDYNYDGRGKGGNDDGPAKGSHDGKGDKKGKADRKGGKKGRGKDDGGKGHDERYDVAEQPAMVEKAVLKKFDGDVPRKSGRGGGGGGGGGGNGNWRGGSNGGKRGNDSGGRGADVQSWRQ